MQLIRIEEELVVNSKTIDARILSRMFLAGAKNLEAKKEWINELNVFPVPDGDTGTNMTMTIMAAAYRSSSSCRSVIWRHWPKRFLPVPCAVQEVTQALSFPSFCEVLPRESRDIRETGCSCDRSSYGRRLWRLHTKRL